MAVLAVSRGQGAGKALVDGCVQWAQARGLTALFLHSQMTATGFYRSCGFVDQGEPFLEADIEHQAMVRSLGEH